MQIIRPKAFAIYASIGLVVASVVSIFYGWSMWGRENPAFPAYEKMRNDNAAEVQKIEAVKAAREKAGVTRPFQEVLLGDKPADTLQNLRVRELATALRSSARSETPDRAGSTKLLSDLPRLMNDDCLRVIGWNKDKYGLITIEKFWYSCKTAEYELVHAEPYRIAGLLQGDRTALTSLQDVPEPPAGLSTFENLPVEPKNLPIPWTSIHYLWFWLAFSGAFALTYAIVGLIAVDQKDEHPLRAVPGFALGWLIMLATLPGFLLTYALWIVWLLLTGDVAAAIKKMNARRSDTLKLKIGSRLLAALKAHTEISGYRDPAVRVTLEPDNLRRALATNILPETMKDEVEEYLELEGQPSGRAGTANYAGPGP